MIHNGKKYFVKNLSFIEGGRKISFVLDTLVNERINPFVRNSDLFVCEASFSSDLEKLAREYKHMTSRQAAEIAKKAQAKRLYLVHLSQRYSNGNDKILNEAKKHFKNTFLPKDLDMVEV